MKEVLEIEPLVSAKFDLAVKSGDAYFFESQVHITGDDRNEKSEPVACVPWQIRTVPALLKKPNSSDKGKDSQDKDTKPQQNQKDVFAPPYVPNLLVKEMQDFTVLLNKFCVLPKHFLLVTKGKRFSDDTEFVKQELPPPPELITTAYRIIQQHQPVQPDGEILGFFNCGKESGASQPHCHFQMVELAPESSDMAVPIENLFKFIKRDGKEDLDIHMLPVPWQHFVALLSPPSDDEELLMYLGNRFTQLLDCMVSATRDVALINGLQMQNGPPHFNILLTKRAMHVIPRRQEGFDLNETSWTPFSNAQAPENTGMLSINALGYAGLFLTRHEAELEAMKSPANSRIAEVLARTGMPIPLQVSGSKSESGDAENEQRQSTS
ncbi:ATP adenylyltransferase [Malassezia yamatoensis]|uniref:ATP adenylyltransferase n=1 Tax=Malassezia yamatoensis TaxID=253288 RepID=A0AAJ6CGM9_9BASI|nr:ATP adenylyltransferase [Malassezia yamatoensis]